MYTRLSQIVELAKQRPTRRLVVAAAEDEPVLLAVRNAINEKIVVPVLVGNEHKIRSIASSIDFDISPIEIIHEPNPELASKRAAQIVRDGHADILMKGLVSTGGLLKAILDKESGLRSGSVLSHVAIFESPYYHKLVAVTDAAMNVAPDFNEKVAMVTNAVSLFHKLGIAYPKVAIISAVETVNPKMEATVHAAMLTLMGQRGQIKSCIIDGPLAIDNAISKEAALHKGIVSEVSGDVDILVTPDINSGNVLYKTLNFMGGAQTAAVIMGARAPIVLTSRADSEDSKLMSIALAAAME